MQIHQADPQFRTITMTFGNRDCLLFWPALGLMGKDGGWHEQYAHFPTCLRYAVGDIFKAAHSFNPAVLVEVKILDIQQFVQTEEVFRQMQKLAQKLAPKHPRMEELAELLETLLTKFTNYRLGGLYGGG